MSSRAARKSAPVGTAAEPPSINTLRARMDEINLKILPPLPNARGDYANVSDKERALEEEGRLSRCVENALSIGYPFLFDVITDRQEAIRRGTVARDSAGADGRD
jgi:hypothetical protein